MPRAKKKKGHREANVVGEIPRRDTPGLRGSPAGRGAAMSMKYTKLDKVGEGAFGVVYKAKDKDSGEIVALKRVRLDGEDEGVPCTAIREISLLKELKHPNIVRLMDVVYTTHKLTLVFEFLEQDLKKYIEVTEGDLDPGLVRHYLQELLSGLAYCHHRNVLHRDLKPQNLLINKGTLKIADFGLGRPLGIPVKRFTPEAVTLWYRAPDVLLGNTAYGFGLDLWSVGCIFAEMATGVPLLTGQGQKEVDQLLAIFKCFGTPSADNWPAMHSYPLSAQYLASADLLNSHESSGEIEALAGVLGQSGVDLLERMFQWEPTSRITAAEALRHRYFSEAENSAPAQAQE
ncbi:Cell division protein kinase 2-like protein CRK1 [Diplonema papillatum]|nr:Cell division protein kinase 2-like protein CRK1 [Diplonema papillatum]